MKKGRAIALIAACGSLAMALHAAPETANPPQSAAPAANVSPGDTAESREAVRAAAEKWLALVDAGQFGKSWDEASNHLFQAYVTRLGWETSAAAARDPLGAVKERKLVSQAFLKMTPQGIKGPFIINEYHTAFEKLSNAIEIVTFGLDEDGQWRASGYFVRPGA